MIHHIVQFEWKADTTPAQIDAAAEGLRSMRGRIDEVRDVRFGANLVDEAVPYTHLLVVVCDDMDAVRRYVAHPVHREVVATFTRPIIQSRLAADLDVGTLPLPDGY